MTSEEPDTRPTRRHARTGSRGDRIAAVFGVLVVALIVGAVLVTAFAGDAGAPPVVATPAQSPEPAATPDPPVHEGHVSEAAATPAGERAASASEDVTRTREEAAADPTATALQEWVDEAMGGPLLFGADTATLTPESEGRLLRVIEVLRQTPGARVEVVGGRWQLVALHVG